VSNLSDLLPAGAAAKQLTFTDSGSGIATKKPVILNSDGTVAEVAGTTTSAALADIQNLFAAGTANTSYNGICYATTEDRIVVVSANDHDAGTYLYPYYTIGTMSSGAITWTTPTILSSYQVDWVDLIYQSNTGRLVVCYHGQAAPDQNKVMCLIGTFGSSPYNTISWAGKTQAFSQTTAYFYNQLADWPGTDKFVIVTLYNDTGSSYRGGMQIGTVGGASSLSFGSAANFTDGLITTYPSFMQLMYDTGITNQFIVVYQVFGGTPSVTSKALTVSGTTITDTTAQNISSGTTIISNCVSAAWDSDTGQALVLYGLTPTSATTAATSSFAVVSTASGSTTPNTPVAFVSGASSNQYAGHYWNALTYDSYRKVFTLLYFADDSTSYLTQVTVSGTTPTQGSNLAATGLLARRSGNATVFDPDSNLVVGVCTNGQDANRVNSYVYTPSGSGSNLTAQAFVGIADSAISASAAGSVIVQGGTVTGVNSGQGFTVGTPSTFGGGVSISYPAMAYDTVHDKMVIAYSDGSNSSYGTAVVATISGSSISYGTQVVFESAGTEWIDVCFDPDQERVVIAYRDSPNSDYGTVIVGEVSGTSITFGSPVVYSTATTQNVNCVYDTSNDKVVIVYYDVSNTGLKAIVGTVSGSSISLGSPTTIVANATWPGVKAVFDSTSNKIVVVYVNQTNGDSDGVVGTVSGTSISFGSIVQFESGSASPLTAAYDASADKTLVVYGDAGNSDYGTSVVASVSGTSISFTSPSVFETSQPGVVKSVYDATAQQTFIAYQDYSASYIGVARAVSISGTTATFSGKTTLVNANPSPFNLGYDPDNGKTIFAFYETTSKALVTSYGDIPLTTGTKYYVTTSGGFSSSADTPSVNAGLAISTTSLLLNGDS